MLKKRVTGCLILLNGIVVQSIGFRKYLPVGRPSIAVEFLNNWGIDEIIILDITASKENRDPDYKLIKDLSAKCYVPLTVGGGINTVEQIKKLMQCGTDKICLNHHAILNRQFITESTKVFGDQCVVVAIDAVKTGNDYVVYDHFNKKPSSEKVIDWAKEIESAGAGELFINSVDRDGMKNGYDIALINNVCEAVNIPVIASGGAGKAQHFEELFTKTRASAGSAANFFHYTEHSVNYVKSFLYNKEIDVRLDTYADYKDFNLDTDSRLEKRDDIYLERLHYQIIPKEII